MLMWIASLVVSLFHSNATNQATPLQPDKQPAAHSMSLDWGLSRNLLRARRFSAGGWLWWTSAILHSKRFTSETCRGRCNSLNPRFQPLTTPGYHSFGASLSFEPKFCAFEENSKLLCNNSRAWVRPSEKILGSRQPTKCIAAIAWVY
jgi:hypothetical protein